VYTCDFDLDLHLIGLHTCVGNSVLDLHLIKLHVGDTYQNNIICTAVVIGEKYTDIHIERKVLDFNCFYPCAVST